MELESQVRGGVGIAWRLCHAVSWVWFGDQRRGRAEPRHGIVSSMCEMIEADLGLAHCGIVIRGVTGPFLLHVGLPSRRYMYSFTQPFAASTPKMTDLELRSEFRASSYPTCYLSSPAFRTLRFQPAAYDFSMVFVCAKRYPLTLASFNSSKYRSVHTN